MATNRTQNPPLGPSYKIWQRETVNGRRLRYDLKVIQQPERARACGSGAKSSADRRPVDPPPVVELKIYEENPNAHEGKDDITFAYEANFFLFATLEVARPVAQARGQAPQQVPVLTGMPVSGMAYLDRPSGAGYFIFPDLSVRHEGLYRLSFNLYEETKHPEDFDKEGSVDSKPKVAGAAPDASFDWRMEVKSDLFTVYSAKKFPGLAESTNLSRTVAEQGCRVRIRRDVRMRRREGKNGEYDDVAEDEYSRQGRPLEQEPYRERSRSASNGSEEGRSQYQDAQNQQYPNSSYHGSPATQNATPHGQHLSFLGGGAQGSQFSQPAPPAPPQQQQPQPQYYSSGPPGPPAYATNPPYHTQPTPIQPSSNYFDSRQNSYPAYQSNPPREDAFDGSYRRASGSTVHPQNRLYPELDSYNRIYQPPAPLPQATSAIQPPQLAPLKMPNSQHETIHSPVAPYPSFNRTAPPMVSPLHERAPERASFSYSHYNEPAPSLQPLQSSLRPSEPQRPRGKRAHGDAFASNAIEPLYNGMRPSSSNGRGNDDVGEEDSIMIPLSYKRADGSEQSRELPTAQVSHLK
jgi:hypothetical protein